MIIPNKLENFLLYKVPKLPNRLDILRYIKKHNTNLSISRVMEIWYEHDAIHYLGNISFDHTGERKVAFLEKKLNRGWLPIGKEYNPYEPMECKYPRITPDAIDKTVGEIKRILDEL